MVVLSTGAVVGSYADEYRRAGVRVLRVPFSKSPMFAWRFWCPLRKEHSDVVHIHTVARERGAWGAKPVDENPVDRESRA